MTVVAPLMTEQQINELLNLMLLVFGGTTVGGVAHKVVKTQNEVKQLAADRKQNVEEVKRELLQSKNEVCKEEESNQLTQDNRVDFMVKEIEEIKKIMLSKNIEEINPVEEIKKIDEIKEVKKINTL
jgi:hypothetical protein